MVIPYILVRGEWHGWIKSTGAPIMAGVMWHGAVNMLLYLARFLFFKLCYSTKVAMHATDCYCVVAHANVEFTTLQEHTMSCIS